MIYVDVGWAGPNCYCRTMWTKFGRLFSHGFVDTTNLVERMWHFIKYTLLRRKVNRRLDELVLSIIGDLSLNGERMGGMTLIEHNRERQMISESGKYSLRGSTKSHTNKLQKTQHIFEKYLENSNEVLREVDIFGLIFEMQSQTKEDVWYTMSMGSEQCDCGDTQSRCKHMLALKKIVDKSYYNVRGVIEEDTFNIYDAIYKEIPSTEEEIGVAETLKTVNDDVELYKDVEDLQKSLQSFNIGTLSIDKKNVS